MTNVKIYQIPASSDSQELQEMNLFLRSHSILGMKKKLIQIGESWIWQVWVEYQFGAAPQMSREERLKKAGDEKEKLRERLGESGLVLFEKLRIWRNETAKSLGIQNYNILKNEHIAQLVEMENPTLGKIESLREVGKKRVEKYGQQILAILLEQGSEKKSEDTQDEDKGSSNGDFISRTPSISKDAQAIQTQ